LADTIADCRAAVVPEAGHAGPHTHADAVIAAMEPFLSALSDEPTATVG
jgi:hypothetical protein